MGVGGVGWVPHSPPTLGLLQAVPGGRVKRYSSQRQRPPVPEPAPPMHISIVEGHYYDPCECFLPAPVAPRVLGAEQYSRDFPTSVGVGICLLFVVVAPCPLMQCLKGSWEPAWLCLNSWNYPQCYPLSMPGLLEHPNSCRELGFKLNFKSVL